MRGQPHWGGWNLEQGEILPIKHVDEMLTQEEVLPLGLQNQEEGESQEEVLAFHQSHHPYPAVRLELK